MKKALKITKTVAAWVLFVIAVLVMIFTIISVNTFDRNDREIFGYKAYIVRSDSMSTEGGDASKGHFKAGDLIFVKYVDASTLKEGDIISYISTNRENFGETVTHMIKSEAVDANGNRGYITYGTSTGVEDENVVIYDYILGKYEGRIAGMGTFFNFLKSTPGYLICILLPFLLLIGIEVFDVVRLVKKYKSEQMAEIDEKHEKERAEIQAEREALEAERARQEEMMQKLLEMQAAMQGDDTVDTNDENSSN